MKLFYTSEEMMMVDLLQNGVDPDEAIRRAEQFLKRMEQDAYREILDFDGLYLTTEDWAPIIESRDGIPFRFVCILPPGKAAD